MFKPIYTITTYLHIHIVNPKLPYITLSLSFKKKFMITEVQIFFTFPKY